MSVAEIADTFIDVIQIIILLFFAINMFLEADRKNVAGVLASGIVLLCFYIWKAGK